MSRTLIEELANIIVDDIHNNKESYVRVMTKDFTITNKAKDIITLCDKSMLTRKIGSIGEIDGTKIISLMSPEQCLTLDTILNIIETYQDIDVPETIVLIIDGKESLVDTAENIRLNIPTEYLNKPLKGLYSGSMPIEGSAFIIDI